MTLIELNRKIQTIGESNAMIRTAFFGSLADRMAQGDIDYPIFCFDLVSAPLTDKIETLNYEFWFLDRMRQDRSNEEDALSDMIAVSNDVVAALTDVSLDISLNKSITRTRIQDESPDVVCGVKLDIALYQPINYNRCQIPN